MVPYVVASLVVHVGVLMGMLLADGRSSDNGRMSEDHLRLIRRYLQVHAPRVAVRKNDWLPEEYGDDEADSRGARSRVTGGEGELSDRLVVRHQMISAWWFGEARGGCKARRLASSWALSWGTWRGA